MTRDEFVGWRSLPETKKVFSDIISAMDDLKAEVLRGALVGESIEKTAILYAHRVGLLEGMRTIIDYEITDDTDDKRH